MEDQEINLTTSMVQDYLKQTPYQQQQPATAVTTPTTQKRRPASKKVNKKKESSDEDESSDDSNPATNTVTTVKRLRPTTSGLNNKSTKPLKNMGAVKRTFEIREAASKFKLQTNSIKQYTGKTISIPHPFYNKYEVAINGSVDASPVCTCKLPMILKGKQFVCPRQDAPCTFIITLNAFKAIIEKDYVNSKVALTKGIVLPKCEQCKCFNITTGGAFYGDSTIVFRCSCRRGVRAVMCKGSVHDLVIQNLCKSGFWNYDSLPNQISRKYHMMFRFFVKRNINTVNFF